MIIAKWHISKYEFQGLGGSKSYPLDVNIKFSLDNTFEVTKNRDTILGTWSWRKDTVYSYSNQTYEKCIIVKKILEYKPYKIDTFGELDMIFEAFYSFHFTLIDEKSITLYGGMYEMSDVDIKLFLTRQ